MIYHYSRQMGRLFMIAAWTYLLSVAAESSNAKSQGSDGRLLQNSGSYLYPTYAEVVTRLQTLANQYPEFVQVWNAQDRYGVPSPHAQCTGQGGASEACRHWFVTVTNRTAPANPLEAVAYRPQVFLSGNLHGNEWVGPVTVMNFLELLLTYGLPSAPSGSYNSWFNKLLNSRTLVAMPVTNPGGYDRRERTDDGVDPNRDFPMFRAPNECMVTTVARAVNEVWRDHLIQSAITFHGGMQAIAYEWGVAEHQGSTRTSESPDDAAQADLGGAMRASAGAFRQNQPGKEMYPTGPANIVVYPVDGGMEDWAYASSWDTTPGASRACTPRTYGGYPAEKTVYNSAVLRAFNVLVEAADDKIPPQNTLGSFVSLQDVFTVEGKGDGHVPRNMRLAAAVLDMVEPYVMPTATRAALHASSSGVRAAAAAAGRVAAAGRALRAEALQQPLPAGVADSPDKRRLQPVPTSFAGPGVCTDSTSAGTSSRCAAFKAQYSSWTALSAPPAAAPEPGKPDHYGEPQVGAWAGWDVGGGMRVDGSAALIGTWDARVPPALLYTAQAVDPPAAPGGPSMPSAAFMAQLTGQYGLSDTEAMSFALYLDAWQGVVTGRTSVDAMPQAFVLAKTTEGQSATRWTPDAGAGTSARFNAGRQLATPAFTTRFSSCVRVYAGTPDQDGKVILADPCDSTDGPAGTRAAQELELQVLQHEGSAQRKLQAGISPTPSAAPFAGTAVRALIVFPYLKMDAGWKNQKGPEPAVPPQSHVVNVRTNPAWLQSNAGYTARGRYQFGTPLFFGVETYVGVSPSPSPTPSKSPQPVAASVSPQAGAPSATPSAAPHTPVTSTSATWQAVGIVLAVPALLACCVICYKRRKARKQREGAARLPEDAEEEVEDEDGELEIDLDEEAAAAPASAATAGRGRRPVAYTDGDTSKPTGAVAGVAASMGGIELTAVKTAAAAARGGDGRSDSDSIDLDLGSDSDAGEDEAAVRARVKQQRGVGRTPMQGAARAVPTATGARAEYRDNPDGAASFAGAAQPYSDRVPLAAPGVAAASATAGAGPGPGPGGDGWSDGDGDGDDSDWDLDIEDEGAGKGAPVAKHVVSGARAARAQARQPAEVGADEDE